MGACCSKFGTYLIRKDAEARVQSNGGTPKLNKLEHKASFVTPPKSSEDKDNDPSNQPEP